MDRNLFGRWRRNRTTPPTPLKDRQSAQSTEPTRAPLELVVLEDRVLYSASPLVLDALQVHVQEDAANRDIDLHDYFSLDDQGASLTFQFTPTAVSPVLASSSLTSLGHLVLDFAANQHGIAQLSIEATDGLGHVEQLPVSIAVDPINDAPTISAILDQQTREDKSTSPLSFTINDIDSPLSSLQVSAISSNGNLIAPSGFHFSGTGAQRTLTIDPRANAHGDTTIEIRVSDGLTTASTFFDLHVESVNDTPTTQGLANFTTTSGGRTTIDLFGAFQDTEDLDSQLHFDLKNSRPDLFSHVEWDLAHGKLILDHAAGKTGNADLTIVATDRGGLTVGGGTPANFHIYDQITVEPSSDSLDRMAAHLDRFTLWTDWNFFPFSNGSYDFSRLDVEKFKWYLDQVPVTDSEIPIVFNIENDYYVNTPAGRDKFAEVLSIAQHERPDLHFGFYAYVPERSFMDPVYFERLQRDEANGLTTWYTAHGDTFEQNYHDWQARNALFRTQATNPAFGGQPVANLLDSINVSLYTVRRDFDDDPYWRSIDVDATANTIHWDGPDVDENQAIRLRLTTNGVMNNGLNKSTTYYARHVQGNTFQLAATPNGQVIDFTNNYTGTLFAGAAYSFSNLQHDPNVIDWSVYAAENIAEGRKFGKPVYAWISPSMAGRGTTFLEQDFFRLQLEVLRPLADSIVIYEASSVSASFHENQGWFDALLDFAATLDDPAAKISVHVSTPSTTPTPIQALADQFSVSEDRPLVLTSAQLLANDHGGNGQPLEVTTSQGPQHGRLESLSGGRWRYTPDTNYQGSDTFTYRAFDGQSYSDPTTVTLQVAGTNDRPVGVDDVVWTTRNQPLVIQRSQLLANDSDVDGNSLNWRLGIGTQHGTLQQNPDGSLIYRPVAGYVGADSFTYWLNDGTQDSARASRVTIQVTSNTNSTQNANGSVEMVAAYLPGNVPTVESGVGGGSGAANTGATSSLNAPATPVTPLVPESSSETNGAIVRGIEPKYIPRALQAYEDHFVVTEDQSLAFHANDLLSNDPNGAIAGLVVEIMDGPKHGALARNGDGQFVYTPTLNFAGSDLFAYRVTRGAVASSVVAVQIQVMEVNDLPIALNDTYRVDAGSVWRSQAGGVLVNDSDGDRDRLQATLLDAPQFGKLSLAADGAFLYEPRSGFSGLDRFRYRVSDGRGGTAVAEAILRVEPGPAATPPTTPVPRVTAPPVTPPPVTAPTPKPLATATQTPAPTAEIAALGSPTPGGDFVQSLLRYIQSLRSL